MIIKKSTNPMKRVKTTTSEAYEVNSNDSKKILYATELIKPSNLKFTALNEFGVEEIIVAVND
jgi:hypothetical protein